MDLFGIRRNRNKLRSIGSWAAALVLLLASSAWAQVYTDSSHLDPAVLYTNNDSFQAQGPCADCLAQMMEASYLRNSSGLLQLAAYSRRARGQGWRSHSHYRTRRHRYYLNPDAMPQTFRGKVTDLRGNSLVVAPPIPAGVCRPATERYLQRARANLLPSFGHNCWHAMRTALEQAGIVSPGSLKSTAEKQLGAETLAQSRIDRLEQHYFKNYATDPRYHLWIDHPELIPQGAILIFKGKRPDVQIRAWNGFYNDTFWPVARSDMSDGRGFKLEGIMFYQPPAALCH